MSTVAQQRRRLKRLATERELREYDELITRRSTEPAAFSKEDMARLGVLFRKLYPE